MSVTQICNRALDKIGADRITDIDDKSPRAEDCKSVYADLRDAELRAAPWTFALHRVTLAPMSGVSDFEFAYHFQLPSDFLRLHPAATYQEETDWTIEGSVLKTNDGNTLYLRYVRRVEDTAIMDPLFREALSTRIAHELAEPATKGLNRKALLDKEYDKHIALARRVNAIEKVSARMPEDEWIDARR